MPHDTGRARTAITTRDAAYQRLETMRSNRTKRRRMARCLVEGVLPLDAAVAAGRVEAFVVAHGRRLSSWADAALAAQPAAEIIDVAPALFDELSEREDPVELAAVVRIETSRLADVDAGPGVVVLDRPSSPGNIGTIIRTAAAFGYAAVVVAGHAADAFDPKSVAASRGAVFALPIVEISGAEQLIAWRQDLRAAGTYCEIATFVAAAEGSVPLHAVRLADAAALALVFGNEAQGISHGFAEAQDVAVHIPMRTDIVDSLNVAVAAGIALQAVALQRVARS